MRRVTGKINPVGQQENPASATGRGKNIEIVREHLVAAGDVEHTLAGVGEDDFRQPDLDGISARGQIGDGKREICAMDFLAERLLAAPRRADNCQAFVSPPCSTGR